MRIRASLAAATVSGVVALTALAAPAAQATDVPAPFTSKMSPFTGNTPADDSQGDTQITKVTVNANSDVVVGVSKKSFNIYVTATDPSGINTADAILWHGTSLSSADADVDGVIAADQAATCDKWSATSATCKITVTAEPGDSETASLYDSFLAGKWNVAVYAEGNDGDYVEKDLYKNSWVKRAASFSGFNASPEPVAKGKAITVTGTLNRASWTYLKYYGYGSQSVQLQFKKAGASTYSTVKTITSSSSGYLKTTVTASVDGTYRFHYAGNSTSSVADAYDYVDVR
ncbi:calcium-binding protein [Streptomyces sp. NPDC054766]|uniref:calcium-binding protein n=1 Tax=Streptomyces rhizosphaerihabitans TaxID=1266770 RepID=UPI0021C1AC73|nr:calcium-binding protein [Streptomyces rhizosphaerihabitans]MCT9005464.1 calcium-binding protein [Streptomyces rhizosphaerihabitans]